MLSSWFLTVLALLVSSLGVTATFIDSLPDCWQSCINNSADCDSVKCFCKASGKGSFLPDAVSCARSKCDTQDWTIDVLLVPLQAYCGAIDKGIPSSIISSAQNIATQSAKPTITDSPKSEDSYGDHKSKSKDDNDDVQTTITTTVTSTTVKDGTTLQIIVPVVVCPSTVEYGSTTTSTIAKATSSPNSVAASPSPTAFPSTLATTPPGGQGKVGSSSSTKAQATTDPKHGGSPFDNMQAEASQWSISGAIIGMALVAGVFVTL